MKILCKLLSLSSLYVTEWWVCMIILEFPRIIYGSLEGAIVLPRGSYVFANNLFFSFRCQYVQNVWKIIYLFSFNVPCVHTCSKTFQRVKDCSSYTAPIQHTSETFLPHNTFYIYCHFYTNSYIILDCIAILISQKRLPCLTFANFAMSD